MDLLGLAKNASNLAAQSGAVGPAPFQFISPGWSGDRRHTQRMNPITLLQPGHLAFGNGCAPQSAAFLASRGVKRVLVVSSTPILPTIGAVTEALAKAGLEIVLAPPIDSE